MNEFTSFTIPPMAIPFPEPRFAYHPHNPVGCACYAGAVLLTHNRPIEYNAYELDWTLVACGDCIFGDAVREAAELS